ncbi:uncharacterized protein LOC111697867 [Eurytemora carolleeae]|uniref:uncharacterized protein LOC111697867 n=1 Tax=Eurytemora carolleeae TaxID=1294199 RepID=UPI000C77B691|nr:uncharacterized protein LOC111697867 [Eurytemora carolleeae]|eukprot:XP_023323771.1 uncharacterized protein LOC111697867 [Eurytemora affinis]
MACTERQFTLYFESSEDDICTSLWSDIHNEKVVSSTLKNLLLGGFQLFCNQKSLKVYHELCNFQLPALKLLDLSVPDCNSEYDARTSVYPSSIVLFLDLVSALSTESAKHLEELNIANFLIRNNVCNQQILELKEHMTRFVCLRVLGLKGTKFTIGKKRGETSSLRTLLSAQKLQEIDLSFTFISREEGISLARTVKDKARKGGQVKIKMEGCCGEGISKFFKILELSKTVLYTHRLNKN